MSATVKRIIENFMVDKCWLNSGCLMHLDYNLKVIILPLT